MKLAWNLLCAIGYVIMAWQVGTDSLDTTTRVIGAVMLSASAVSMTASALLDHQRARNGRRR